MPLLHEARVAAHPTGAHYDQVRFTVVTSDGSEAVPGGKSLSPVNHCSIVSFLVCQKGHRLLAKHLMLTSVSGS